MRHFWKLHWTLMRIKKANNISVWNSLHCTAVPRPHFWTCLIRFTQRKGIIREITGKFWKTDIYNTYQKSTEVSQISRNKASFPNSKIISIIYGLTFYIMLVNIWLAEILCSLTLNIASSFIKCLKVPSRGIEN